MHDALVPLRHIPGVTPELVATYRPHAPGLVARITGRILREVAGFAGDANFHDVIAEAIGSAVTLFVDALAGAPVHGKSVDAYYRWLGRVEAEAGHDLDAMRAAHHIATQECWNEVRSVTRKLGLPADTAAQIGDVLHAYQTRLFEQAVRGFAQARQEQRAAHDGVRGDLLALLLAGAEPDELAALACQGNWPLPESVAVAMTHASDRAVAAVANAKGALAGVQGGRLVVVVDASQMECIAQQLAPHSETPIAVSWGVPPAEAHHAARWAARALHLASQGIIATPCDGILWCIDHRADLCLHADPVLRRCTDEDLLAPLLGETDKRRADLAETMLVWLQTREGAPGLAERLHVHQQTVRHRLKRLKELFGDQLNDPSKTVGLLTALESATRRWRRDP